MKTVVAVWLVFASTSAAFAQAVGLTGVVRDGSGAVVPGSTVVVRQPGSAFERVVETGRLSATGTPLAIYRPDVGRTVRAGIRWSWTK